MMTNAVLIGCAYLLGSLSSAIILCRILKLPDPREEGSGNPGATNVLRFGGKKVAASVLLGDVLKGLIPVLIVSMLGFENWVIASVGLAAFLGHVFPVFFGFKGGKGVATAIGVIFGISWIIGLSLIVIWLLMSYIFHISSLAALIAAVSAPLLTWLIIPDTEPLITISIMSIILLWRHQKNIRNLLNGTEPRIGKKTKKK